MKRKLSTLLFIAICIVRRSLVFAEWLSIEGGPAKWNDIIEIRLRDLHPTQPTLGFDRVFYKLGRYPRNRRKVFDDYCKNNGEKGIRDFSGKSDIQDPKSFTCLEAPGSFRDDMKTVVIGPDEKLYLTDGHHTFNIYWHMKGGGPELRVYVIVSRDYRNFASMDEFWKQMVLEKNMWLYDTNDNLIPRENLPPSLGLEHFVNDPLRSLMYFTRRIAWISPGLVSVPNPKFHGDEYPDIPFVEFYWMRELRKTVDVNKFDLNTLDGYVAAIKTVGAAIIALQSNDVGGSGKPTVEMGQFKDFNEKELARVARPGTGKLAYMMKFKSSPEAKTHVGKKF